MNQIVPGSVTVTCAAADALTQQQGFVHGGVLASLADVACGYAALTKMAEDREVLTVEFKVNFLKAARSDRLVAVGQVIQSGRTLTVCERFVYDTRARFCWRS